MVRLNPAVTVIAAWLSLPSAARADDWYGWQTLATDATADTLLVGGGLFGESKEAAIAAAALYTFGGPIVHVAHGEWGRAGISLGLRLGLPTLGGLVGGALCFDRKGFLSCLGSAVLGIGVGILGAEITDAALGDTHDHATMLQIGGAF